MERANLETFDYYSPIEYDTGGGQQFFPSPPPPPIGGEGTGGEEFFPLPYISPQTGQPVLSTGLQLQPGQSYKPGQSSDKRVFFNYPNAPTFSRGSYPSSRQSDVSYLGPTVSARPAFNINLRGLRVRDVFNRRRRLFT